MRWSALPPALTEAEQWICWRFEERTGKATKVPLRADGNGFASSTNLESWTDFETACEAVEKIGADGIGFVFGANDDFFGIDLDNCIDADGDVEPWALPILERFDSYHETSPSGNGIKIFCRGEIIFPDKGGRARYGRKVNVPNAQKDAAIEAYHRARYFTVTGEKREPHDDVVKFGGTDCDWLVEMMGEYAGDEGSSSKTTIEVRPALDVADEEIIDRIQNRAGALWRGEVPAGKSHSEADLALCNHLAFWCGYDPPRIERLFGRSGLVRDKWRERADYREWTVGVALRDRTQFADWCGGNGHDHGSNGSNGSNGQPVAVDLDPPAPRATSDGRKCGLPDWCFDVPGFVNEFADFACRTAWVANRKVAVMAGLALQSHLAAIKVKGRMSPALYVIPLCNSGGGKDRPMRAIEEVMAAIKCGDVDNPRGTVLREAASAEGLQEHMEVNPETILIVDEIDWMIRLMGQEGPGVDRFDKLMKMLLQQFSTNGAEFQTRVKAGVPTETIDHASLVIYGTAIPSHFYDAISAKMLTNGLFARLLVADCSGVRRETKTPSDETIPPSVLEPAKYWWKADPKSIRVTWTPEARDHRQKYFSANDDRWNVADMALDAVKTSSYGRGPELANKLAMCRACSICEDNPLVDFPAMDWGIKFAEQIVGQALGMLDDYHAENPFEETKKKILGTIDGFLEGRGFADRATVLKNSKMKARDFGDIVRTLIDTGEVIEFPPPAGVRQPVFYATSRTQVPLQEQLVKYKISREKTK